MIQLIMKYGTAKNRIHFASIYGVKSDGGEPNLHFKYGEVLRESWSRHNKKPKQYRATAVLKFLNDKLGLTEPQVITEHVKKAVVTKPAGFDTIEEVENFLMGLCREINAVRYGNKNKNNNNQIRRQKNGK